MSDETTTEFWVHCGECGHAWVAAILPMAVDDFVRLAKRASCPRGHRGQVFCGNGQADPAANAGKADGPQAPAVRERRGE